MTSFATQYLVGPVIGSMVGSDKGDFSNRTKCAGAQLVNNLKTAGASVALGAVGFGAARYVAKSPRRIVKTAQVFDKLVNKLPKGGLKEALTKLPKLGKAGLIIGLPLIAIANFIGMRSIYKMGQIDQKYTDKAKIEEATNKNILA